MKYDMYYITFDDGAGDAIVEFFDNKDVALFAYLLVTYCYDRKYSNSSVDEILEDFKDLDDEVILHILSLNIDSSYISSEDIYTIDKKFCELVFEYCTHTTNRQFNILLAYSQYFYQNNIPQFTITQINKDTFEFYRENNLILKIKNYFDKITITDIQNLLLEIQNSSK